MTQLSVSGRRGTLGGPCRRPRPPPRRRAAPCRPSPASWGTYSNGEFSLPSSLSFLTFRRCHVCIHHSRPLRSSSHPPSPSRLFGLRPDPVSLAPPRRHTHPRPVRYDFALFGFFSDVIATVFFPPPSEGDDGEEESTSRLVASFAVYGGAFLMRPVGGLVIGRIGDRHGRKRALVVSLSLMAFPTFLM